MSLNLDKQRFASKSGLYVLGVPDKPNVYKIGLSTNLILRLANYHTCHSSGYQIFNIAILDKFSGKHFSKQTENVKKRITNLIRAVEKGAISRLDELPNSKAKRAGVSERHEWFKVDNIQTMTNAIQYSYKKYKKKPLHVKNRVPVNLKPPYIITDMDQDIFNKK